MSLVKKYYKYFIFILFIFTFVFTLNIFLNNNCKNYRLFKAVKNFGISHASICFSKENLSYNAKILLKPYPMLFELGRNFQRKYVSKFKLDEFQITDINETKKNSLPEYKIKKGILGKKVIYSEIAANDKLLLEEITSWHRSHGGNWNSHFSSSKEINKKNINKLKLAWKYSSIDKNDLDKKWIENIQVNPIFIDEKIILITADWKIVALDAKDGSLIWEIQSLFAPSRRGILAYSDKGINYLILPIANKVYKININNGKLEKNFGSRGYIEAKSNLAPMIYNKSLVIVSTKGAVETFELYSGNKLNEIMIHDKKNFSGGVPWGGAAIDIKKGIVFVVTGNPRPGLYGVNRPGSNKNSSSIVAIDLNDKKIKWAFQDVPHDLWDYDIASPPIIHNLKINKQYYEVVIALTKTGNVLMLERNSGEPIFDLVYKKAPKSDVIGEITSDYQLNLLKPEKFSKVSFNLDDINELNEAKIKQLKKRLKGKKYGWFEPPSYKNDLILFGLHGGAQWPGAALDHFNQELYIPTGNVPYEARILLLSKYADKKNFLNSRTIEIYETYKAKCASCHLINRNGEKDKFGEKITKNIPSLVGLTLINKKKDHLQDLYLKAHKKEFNLDIDAMNILFNEWDKYLIENKLIRTQNWWSAFLTDDDLPASNPPWGYIAKINLKTGKLHWKKPVGKKIIDGNIKNIGTQIFGGVALNNNGILFITGTDDNYVYAMDANNGEILWDFEMNAAGSAPPIIFEVDNKEYVSILSTGGSYYSYNKKDSSIYTFALE